MSPISSGESVRRPEQRAHALHLGGGRPLEHRDERERALALAQVGADRLAEPILVGHEVEGVVRDLEGDADGEPVVGEGLDRLRVDAAQQSSDPAARRHESRGLLGDDPEDSPPRRS